MRPVRENNDGSLNRPPAVRSAAGHRSSCISNKAGWHGCAVFHASICCRRNPTSHAAMSGVGPSQAENAGVVRAGARRSLARDARLPGPTFSALTARGGTPPTRQREFSRQADRSLRERSSPPASAGAGSGPRPALAGARGAASIAASRAGSASPTRQHPHSNASAIRYVQCTTLRTNRSSISGIESLQPSSIPSDHARAFIRR
jgi:hypothetical protein